MKLTHWPFFLICPQKSEDMLRNIITVRTVFTTYTLPLQFTSALTDPTR